MRVYNFNEKKIIKYLYIWVTRHLTWGKSVPNVCGNTTCLILYSLHNMLYLTSYWSLSVFKKCNKVDFGQSKLSKPLKLVFFLSMHK